MKTSWPIELPQILIIVGMLATAAICWQSVPEKMPIHWNASGEVDGYGGRFMGLLLVPIIAAGMYLLLLFLPRIDPGYANYKQFASSYHLIRISLLVYFAAIYGACIAGAYGYPRLLPKLIPLLMGMLFIILGNVMGKIRQNWFVGIRTPWTLSSKLSWAKTHRLGGWLFIATGVVVLVTGLLAMWWSIVAMLAMMGVAVVTMVVYSYVVWKNDPERGPPTFSAPRAE
jgi:uncharacterized membrane protein